MVIWSGALEKAGHCPTLSSYLSKPGHGSCLTDAIPPDDNGISRPRPPHVPATPEQKAEAVRLVKLGYGPRIISQRVGITVNQATHVVERVRSGRTT